MFNKSLLKAAVGLSSILLVQSAMAAPCIGVMDVTTTTGSGKDKVTVTTPTAYDISKKVSTASSCVIGTASNDSVSPNQPFTVNEEAFFGVSDWKFDNKFESGSTPSLANFSFGAGGFLSGSYTLTAEALKYEKLMFVLKSGSGTSLVAYLLDPKNGGGTINTPFLAPPFDFNGGSTQKAISHISVYYNGEGGGGSNEVPEPASMALLGLGALGMMSLRRKRAAKA